jgi:hypothetical protein
MPWDNASTVFQVLYPQNSINPGTKPFGGAQFYASPLNIADAQAMQFTYSVFFPSDFDWVKAGKLPGLFGGRPSCSGGDAATDCFSTRLMWRQDGMGELYLVSTRTHVFEPDPAFLLCTILTDVLIICLVRAERQADARPV